MQENPPSIPDVRASSVFYFTLLSYRNSFLTYFPYFERNGSRLMCVSVLFTSECLNRCLWLGMYVVSPDLINNTNIKARYFLFCISSRPALDFHWVQGACSHRLKWRGRESDHSPPSGAEEHNLLFSDSFAIVDMGRFLWRDDESVVYDCLWPSPAE
jgi:hypothetical protein